MPSIEGGLFEALEHVLKNAKQPYTCVEMYDLPEIRKLAESSNRVSDYLGGLWRKGKVLRLPAPRTSNSSARWMYAWKPQAEGKARSTAVEYQAPLRTAGHATLYSKPNIEITENGGMITIDLPSLSITIRTK